MPLFLKYNLVNSITKLLSDNWKWLAVIDYNVELPDGWKELAI